MSDSGTSFWKWFGGIAGTIIAGVVLWWLTGPLSPFVKKDTTGNNKIQQQSESSQSSNNNAADPVQKEPQPEQKIIVEATPDPYTITAGDQAAINVLAHTADNSPIENAHVEIGAGGGFFSISGNHVELGTTNSNGVFKTYWKAPDPAAIGYGLDITVSKDGMITGRAEVTVHVNNH